MWFQQKVLRHNDCLNLICHSWLVQLAKRQQASSSRAFVALWSGAEYCNDPALPRLRPGASEVRQDLALHARDTTSIRDLVFDQAMLLLRATLRRAATKAAASQSWNGRNARSILFQHARFASQTAAALEPRESMEFDVCIVGAGPAGLSAAIKLKQVLVITECHSPCAIMSNEVLL